MTYRYLPFTLILMAILLAAPCLATADNSEHEADPRVLNSESFLNAHPDLKWRQQGLKAYEKGEYEEAFAYFKRGARFADKPSQGMVAEMLWRGEGVTQDRAAAYAWMDLAAERNFRTMLIQRELYWEALGEPERERTLELGKGIYAEYGDKVAQPRLERKMRFAKRNSAGSRTGFAGALTIVIQTPSGARTIDGSTYYHPDYWEPDRYWAWQAKDWKNPPRGQVDIGPLSTPAATPAAKTKAEEDPSE